MPKNIILFSDGTGQEGGKSTDSNVYKLFKMMENRTDKQVTFYDRGLGTGWRKITGSGTGMGISKNIQECYQFIFENYNAGDQIYLFGFSRGATTVRSLSNFIHLFGILPKSRPELIKHAYKIYKTRDRETRDRRASDFVARNHTMWSRIKFLGVWDTVAALGIPLKAIDVVIDHIPFFRHSFQDLRLCASVENGRHALAIDDERLTFHPTPWNNVKTDYQTIKQVWFCGMHTDVGGGYAEKELSDIALQWMIAEATAFGLRVYPRHAVLLNPDPDGTMHDSRGKGFAKAYRKCVRNWNSEKNGKAVVHQSVLDRKRDRNNNPANAYQPWILNEEYDIEPWPTD